MPKHTVLILRASDGEPLAEVPHTGLSITRVLTGMGGCEFSIPLGSGKTLRSLLGPGQGREVAVIRTNGSDVRCVFDGPLVSTERGLTGEVKVTAADPGWYLNQRVTEGARNYGRNVLAVVKDLVDTAMGVPPRDPKPNGLLYRLTVDPISGGPVKRWAIGVTDRLPIMDMITDLSDDDTGGFDYRWDYGYVPEGMVVSRVLRLGHPTLGVNRPDVIVEPPHMLAFSDVERIDRAATRVHVLGAGAGKGRRRAVAVNAPAHTAGLPLLETAVERTNVNNQATLNGMANAYRRILAPPTRVIQTTHRIVETGGLGLTFDSASLGDTVRVRVYAGDDQLDMTRRVVAETFTFATDGEESVQWTYNDPTDTVVS